MKKTTLLTIVSCLLIVCSLFHACSKSGEKPTNAESNLETLLYTENHDMTIAKPTIGGNIEKITKITLENPSLSSLISADR